MLAANRNFRPLVNKPRFATFAFVKRTVDRLSHTMRTRAGWHVYRYDPSAQIRTNVQPIKILPLDVIESRYGPLTSAGYTRCRI